MSEKVIWIVKVRGKEMEENFEKIIKEGIELDNKFKRDLKIMFPKIENFIIQKDGKEKIRFWRFIKGKKDWVFPKEGDYLIFEVPQERALYVTITSNTADDPYDETLRNYKLLKIPHPTIHTQRYSIKFPKVFLIKILGKIPKIDIIETLKTECSCEPFSDLLLYCKSCPEAVISKLLSQIPQESHQEMEFQKEDHDKVSLNTYFTSKGYHLPDHLIAQFYTALKTKGFVILSGLSGTGKTKIALEFAELLEKKEKINLPQLLTAWGSNDTEEQLKKALEEISTIINEIGYATLVWGPAGKAVKIKTPFVLWIAYNNHINAGFIVSRVYRLQDLERDSELKNRLLKGYRWALIYDKRRDVEQLFNKDIAELMDTFKHIKNKNDRVVFLEISKSIPVSSLVKVSDIIVEKDTGETYSPKQISQSGYSKVVKLPPVLEVLINAQQHTIAINFLFLSVRPDWRDSKPLLGYYNPLTDEYHKTPLLEFILRAIKDYDQNKEKAMPYFIILDEMNLAHVEYYFADFLSVLESGRDESGFTRESIKLHNVDAVEKLQGIPKEIKLPPNLYIIGTVNIDETTYMFSPKVLDRAFTIEFHDVELEEYPPERTKLSLEEIKKLRDAVLDDLRRDGRFLAVYKKGKDEQEGDIEKALKELKDANNGKYWEILKQLNKALEPYDLHFGYRVVDEIALFFKNAKESWKDYKIVRFENEDEIFDLALLMKVLPKFHGNRKKLEKPLLPVLKLAKKGMLDEKDADKDVDELFKEVFGTENTQNKSDVVVKVLANSTSNYTFQHTAKKVLRMLRQLYEIGFASFS